jgi:hypothetical protein
MQDQPASYLPASHGPGLADPSLFFSVTARGPRGHRRRRPKRCPLQAHRSPAFSTLTGRMVCAGTTVLRRSICSSVRSNREYDGRERPWRAYRMQRRSNDGKRWRFRPASVGTVALRQGTHFFVFSSLRSRTRLIDKALQAVRPAARIPPADQLLGCSRRSI